MIKKFKTKNPKQNKTLNNLNDVVSVSNKFYETGSKSKKPVTGLDSNKIYFGEIETALNNSTGTFAGTFYDSNGDKLSSLSNYYQLDIYCDDVNKANIKIGNTFVAIRNKQDGEFYCLCVFNGSGSSVRKAYAKTDAGAGNSLNCYLDTDSTGIEVTVYFELLGITDLEDGHLDIEDGTGIWIAYNSILSRWECTTPVQGTTSC